MGKPIIWSGVNAKLINSGDLLDKNNNSLTNGSKITVVQSAHGFTSADVGRPLYLNGGTWTLAIATSVAVSTIAGFIYSVLDVNTLLISFNGLIPNVGANFLEGGGSLTAGTIYYLSPTTAGSVTSTAPSTAGQISLVVGEALTSTNFIAGVQSGRVLYESQIIDVSTSTNALRVTQRGSGPALLIEDEANPDSTPFVITNTGRVGVGTLTPSYAFDLNGTGFRLNNLTGGQSTLFIESTTAGVNNWSIRSGTAGFLFRDTTNALDRLVINNDGNIGCGISLPQQRLDVNGTAKVTEVTDRNNFSLTNGDKIDVAQASHGFTTADIGRPLYLNGTTWTLAQADTAAKAEVAGFIYGIVNANNLKIATSGEIPAVGANFLEGGGSLTAGEAYFLSATTAGKVTATEPTNVGYVSKPLGVAKSTTSFQFFNFRGMSIGSTNARTQISLSNNTTATIQNMSSYDAGEIVGWVYIDATTDYRFYVSAQFAKNGAGSNYNLSYQTVGDTPPAGFSITITSGGVIQYTMPNVTGFSSAIFNYALNAPAVGTTFPLSIDGSTIVSGTVSSAYLPVASASASGIVNTTTQTLAGLKTFSSAIIIGNNSTSDANLGTISSVSNSAYYEGSFVANFNAGIANSTNNITIKYVRVGNVVTLNIPQLKITAAATTFYLETPNGTIPSALRPSSDSWLGAIALVDNNVTYLGGFWLLYASGFLSFRNYRTGGASTNWTSGTTNCGFSQHHVTYTLT